jgi:cytochrome c-type biogenesis protein CcmH
VSPGDTLFVFAQAVEGPRIPLAILRAQARELPFKFTLDDSSAMAAGMNLSSQKSVVVSARISKSGSATPQSGDLQGSSGSVTVGQSDVIVVIDAENR